MCTLGNDFVAVPYVRAYGSTTFHSVRVSVRTSDVKDPTMQCVIRKKRAVRSAERRYERTYVPMYEFTHGVRNAQSTSIIYVISSSKEQFDLMSSVRIRRRLLSQVSIAVQRREVARAREPARRGKRVQVLTAQPCSHQQRIQCVIPLCLDTHTYMSWVRIHMCEMEVRT